MAAIDRQWNFQGRKYLVTGGGTGIGREVALELANRGGQVLVAGRRWNEISRTADETGGTAIQMDVSNGPAVKSTFRALGPLDGLVQCAGIGGFGPILSTSDEAWREVMGVDLDGAFYCLREAARGMVDRGGGGVIVNVGSIAGRYVHRGLASYCAAKAGLHALTRSAAAELGGAHVRVNTIAPGCVRTPLGKALFDNDALVQATAAASPLGRTAEVGDIAGAVLFLLSDASRWINGQIIVVDGGLTVRAEPKWTEDSLWSMAGLQEQASFGRAPMTSQGN